jgi:hypothetical protein
MTLSISITVTTREFPANFDQKSAGNNNETKQFRLHTAFFMAMMACSRICVSKKIIINDIKIEIMNLQHKITNTS